MFKYIFSKQRGYCFTKYTGGKMKSLRLLYCLMAFLLLQSILNAQGVQPLGSGTESDPYQVSSLDNLLWMSSNTVTGMFFEQTSDIDASATQNWNIGNHDNDPNTPDSAMGFQPIGEFHNSIAQYDGNGYTISDLNINRPNEDDVGLFSNLYRSKVVNLNLSDACITGDNCTGGIAGYLQYSIIISCHTSGIIKSCYGKCGGISSWIENTRIANCTNDCTVIGGEVGGIIGSAYYIDAPFYCGIQNCTNTGTIVSHSWGGGGIMGGGIFVNLVNCVNYGSVISYSNYSGGICGLLDNSTITCCTSYGQITGSRNIGGIAGAIDKCNVRNCFSRSDVTCQYTGGGFCGISEDSYVNNCYSTGLVSGEDIGGLMGTPSWFPDNTIRNCFWDTETSGLSITGGGGTGKTTSEMKNLSTFVNTSTVGLYSAWDFTGLQGNDSGTNDYWDINSTINDGYPYLLNPTDNTGQVPNGTGTNDDPYLISSLANLQWLSYTPEIWNQGAFFELTSNIDAAETITWNNGKGFGVIGTELNPFIGNVNGNGHNIYNLYLNLSPDQYIEIRINTGMFGNVENSEFYDLNVVNFEYVGQGTTGGFVGEATNTGFESCSAIGASNIGFCVEAYDCTFQDCYSVTNSRSTTGGMFIRTAANSIIENCYCVSKAELSGGFAVFLYDCTITGCYSECKTLDHRGFSDSIDNSTIENCYSIADSIRYGDWCPAFINISTGTSTIKNSYFFTNTRAAFCNTTNDDTVILNCFWCCSGDSIESTGGTRVSLAEMKDIATFTDLNTTGLDTPWDFLGTPFDDTGSDDIWAIDPEINDGFPYLYNNYQYFDITDNDDNTVPELPEVSGLNGNYPNPFNPETTISYSLAETGRVNIVVYNIKGQKVTTLVNEQQEKGNHSIKWSGRDSNSKNVSSGVYFVRMKAGKDVSTHKMLLLK